MYTWLSHEVTVGRLQNFRPALAADAVDAFCVSSIAHGRISSAFAFLQDYSEHWPTALGGCRSLRTADCRCVGGIISSGDIFEICVKDCIVIRRTIVRQGRREEYAAFREDIEW